MLQIEHVEAIALAELGPMGTTTKSTTITVEVEKPEVVKIPDEKKCHFPFFSLIMSLIQIGLFYGFVHLSTLGVLIAIFAYDPQRRHELWRFLTVCLAHIGTFHLLSNVFFQLILGGILERVYIWWKVAVIYFASIVGSVLFISAFAGTKLTAGASGAVYGLLLAHLATIILNWKEVNRKYCRLFWLLAYMFLDIWANFVINIPVSHAGHIGGAITGFFVSILVLHTYHKNCWQKKLQKISSGILISLFVVIFLINVSLPSHYLPTEWNFNYNHTGIQKELYQPRVQQPRLEVKYSCDDFCQLMKKIRNRNRNISDSSANMTM